MIIALHQQNSLNYFELSHIVLDSSIQKLIWINDNFIPVSYFWYIFSQESNFFFKFWCKLQFQIQNQIIEIKR